MGTILLQQIMPYLPQSTSLTSLMFPGGPKDLGQEPPHKYKPLRASRSDTLLEWLPISKVARSHTSSYKRAPEERGERKAARTGTHLDARHVPVRPMPLSEHLLCAGRCSRHRASNSFPSSSGRQTKEETSPFRGKQVL